MTNGEGEREEWSPLVQETFSEVKEIVESLESICGEEGKGRNQAWKLKMMMGKICERGQFWVLTCGAEEKGSHRPGTSGWAHEHPKGVDIFRFQDRFWLKRKKVVLFSSGQNRKIYIPLIVQ